MKGSGGISQWSGGISQWSGGISGVRGRGGISEVGGGRGVRNQWSRREGRGGI